jgi:toxin YoeB
VKLLWSDAAWEDYLHWQQHDAQVFNRLNALIKAIEHSPFKGLGKPEPLKHALSGWWSRRITREHRLVYRVTGTPGAEVLEIVQCRYHY